MLSSTRLLLVSVASSSSSSGTERQEKNFLAKSKEKTRRSSKQQRSKTELEIRRTVVKNHKQILPSPFCQFIFLSPPSRRKMVLVATARTSDYYIITRRLLGSTPSTIYLMLCVCLSGFVVKQTHTHTHTQAT